MRKFTMMYTGLQVYSAEEVDAKLKEYDEDNLVLSQAASRLSARIATLNLVRETQATKLHSLEKVVESLRAESRKWQREARRLECKWPIEE